MVTDHFARLALPPSAWLDPDALKEKFLTRSAELHPDKADDKAAAELEFQALNGSYQILRNSRARLLHLLDLLGLGRPEHVQAIPPLALDLFSTIAELTRASDALLKEKTSANSPMLKVQWFEKALPCIDRLQALQNEIKQRINRIEAQLQQLPPNAPALSISSILSEAAAALGFLERWHAQLQERAAALTF
jgi:DnaJ-domain-containing protein 1